jgi:adenylate cyclase
MSQTRRLAAILAADVAGYSRLMGADEEGTLERLKALRRELLDPKIAEHRGRIVKTTGDGLLVEFASVVDAVRCAVAVQQATPERNSGVAADNRIELRIGINLGDVIVEGDDLYGDGVNIAARIEALADAGGVFVSNTVRDQVRDRLPFVFEDLGEQSVKNIARPVRVYAWRPEGLADPPTTRVPIAVPTRPRHSILAPIGAALATVLVIAVITWWFWPTTRPSPTATPAAAATTSIAQPLVAPRLSIVVLAFTNLSNDPEQQYFADGITEDVTTDLSRLAGMFVISRNTAFTYKNKPVDVKQIGHELGVRYVLEGSVQRSGNQLRVTAQLIDAETDAHLWAERFDRDAGDLFALQNEITGRIANALNIELIAAEAARPTEHPDALDYIFRGRALMNKPVSRDNFDAAISLFERALVLDPNSVEAQSRLASALVGRVFDDMTPSLAADIGHAEELVERALAQFPNYPHAHYVKGQLLRWRHRFDEALVEYETSLAFNRNFVNAYFWIARCKFLTGSVGEAIGIYQKAIRLSPRDPNISLVYHGIGEAYLLQSRIDESILWLEKARSANPVHGAIHASLAAAYALKGDTERAGFELTEARRLSVANRYSSIAGLQASGIYFGVTTIRSLYETTFFAGLRKAGMPEE